MKIKSYYASSDAAVVRQNLDKWDTFNQVTLTAGTTQGQNVQQTSALVSAGGSISVALTTGVATPTGTWVQALAVGDTLLINGMYFYNSTVAVAGSTTALTLSPGPITTVVGTAALSFKVAVQGQGFTYPVYAPTMDTMNISAHGIDIYQNFPTKFFNSYTSYHYGGPNINTPVDRGLCFVPFALYPGTYQPSGHINVSRAREFYLSYTSSVISTGVEGTLVVIASAINFLLISDGSAVLRYST